MPTLGDIAYCQNQMLGLITRIRNEDRVTYYGIQLAPEKYGAPWQSVAPEVVGNIHTLLEGTVVFVGENE